MYISDCTDPKLLSNFTFSSRSPPQCSNSFVIWIKIATNKCIKNILIQESFIDSITSAQIVTQFLVCCGYVLVLVSFHV